MLPITRHIGESVMIGDNIEVIIARVDKYNVRLHIQAPREITILRRELYDAAQRRNQQDQSES